MRCFGIMFDFKPGFRHRPGAEICVWGRDEVLARKSKIKEHSMHEPHGVGSIMIFFEVTKSLNILSCSLYFIVFFFVLFLDLESTKAIGVYV